MSLMPLDFGDEIKPLKPGTYSARIVAFEPKVKEYPGTDKKPLHMINWQFETFGSPEINGKRIYHMTPTTGGWATKTAELHKAATGEAIDKSAKQYDPEMLVSKEITVTVVNKGYTKNDGSTGERLEVVSIAPKK